MSKVFFLLYVFWRWGLTCLLVQTVSLLRAPSAHVFSKADLSPARYFIFTRTFSHMGHRPMQHFSLIILNGEADLTPPFFQSMWAEYQPHWQWGGWLHWVLVHDTQRREDNHLRTRFTPPASPLLAWWHWQSSFCMTGPQYGNIPGSWVITWKKATQESCPTSMYYSMGDK